jgi:ABC-type sugar transport system substrate-binding protein
VKVPRCLLALLGVLALSSQLSAGILDIQAQAPPPTTAIAISVIGESNLKTDFVDALKEAAKEVGLKFEIVPRTDESRMFTFAIAQESTLGSAAAAVIVLDRSGDVAMSVVRSGRFSAKGAFNACAKELVKKLASLSR